MKYLLIPEEDWQFFRDHSNVYGETEFVFDKKTQKRYEKIREKKYRSVEHPF